MAATLTTTGLSTTVAPVTLFTATAPATPPISTTIGTTITVASNNITVTDITEAGVSAVTQKEDEFIPTTSGSGAGAILAIVSDSFLPTVVGAAVPVIILIAICIAVKLFMQRRRKRQQSNDITGSGYDTNKDSENQAQNTSSTSEDRVDYLTIIPDDNTLYDEPDPDYDDKYQSLPAGLGRQADERIYSEIGSVRNSIPGSRETRTASAYDA